MLLKPYFRVLRTPRLLLTTSRGASDMMKVTASCHVEMESGRTM